MIVLGRAKTNSSSTRGPNKITDLKLQGHAWRFCLHPSALFITQEKNETDREEEGERRDGIKLRVVQIHTLLVLCNAYFPDIFVIQC